ncbi:MAG: type II secretion system F family protein [Planctomycetales bacterium]|nr:type II secretion system F family protein [Planctomycetales bacterium]
MQAVHDLSSDADFEKGASSLSLTKNAGFTFARLLPKRASKRSLLIVFRQLALLVETGIDLAEAIELAAASCRNALLREALEEIHEAISNGKSLSNAVQAQEEVVGNQIAASIQAGEASGRLVDVLRQIADQLEEELKMRSVIVGSLAYPAILCMASCGVALILIWFVLPQFEKSFLSMEVEPPLFTQYLIKTASLIRANVIVVVGIIVAVIVSAVGLWFQPWARRAVSDLCFFSPVLGSALRNLAIGQLFVSMAHLLRNGISLLDAIQLMQRSSFDGSTQQLVDAWEADVIEGRGLTHRLDEFGFLPEGADAMLVMAEKTGKLELVLATAGLHYRNEGTTRLHQLLKLSEPIIIIGLGVFVGIVVASVLLPMLDVQSASAAR